MKTTFKIGVSYCLDFPNPTAWKCVSIKPLAFEQVNSKDQKAAESFAKLHAPK